MLVALVFLILLTLLFGAATVRGAIHNVVVAVVGWLMLALLGIAAILIGSRIWLVLAAIVLLASATILIASLRSERRRTLHEQIRPQYEELKRRQLMLRLAKRTDDRSAEIARLDEQISALESQLRVRAEQ